MKQVRFEFEELPYDTLSQFGLTQEMIEDLPMQTLEEISHGRQKPFRFRAQGERRSRCDIFPGVEEITLGKI